MHVASFLVVSLAFAIVNMLLLSRSAEVSTLRLSRGLLVALILSVVHASMFALGYIVGGLLRFEGEANPLLFARQNAYICLGLVLFVAVRLLLPYLRREPRLPRFDLASNASVAAMSVASGINLFLVGIGMGFASPNTSIHLIVWPLLVFSFVLSYVGIMFGRRNVAFRPRRWMILSCVLILATAVAAVVNS